MSGPFLRLSFNDIIIIIINNHKTHHRPYAYAFLEFFLHCIFILNIHYSYTTYQLLHKSYHCTYIFVKNEKIKSKKVILVRIFEEKRIYAKGALAKKKH